MTCRPWSVYTANGIRMVMMHLTDGEEQFSPPTRLAARVEALRTSDRWLGLGRRRCSVWPYVRANVLSPMLVGAVSSERFLSSLIRCALEE